MDRGDKYSRNVEGMSSGMTAWFGRNLRASGLGVSSVWMKIVRFACAVGDACRENVWLYGCRVGRCVLLEGDKDDTRGASLKYLVEVL